MQTVGVSSGSNGWAALPSGSLLALTPLGCVRAVWRGECGQEPCGQCCAVIVWPWQQTGGTLCVRDGPSLLEKKTTVFYFSVRLSGWDGSSILSSWADNTLWVSGDSFQSVLLYCQPRTGKLGGGFPLKQSFSQPGPLLLRPGALNDEANADS